MADNVAIKSDGTTTIATVATDKVTYSSEPGVDVQLMRPVSTTGVEGSKTVVDIFGAAGTPATPVLTVQGNASGTPVPVAIASGTLTPPRATTSTLANVAGSLTSVTLQASNAARLALRIFNDSESNLRVKFGSTASATSFTHLLGPGESLREDLYTGIVTGIWDTAVGSARMTELTA